VNLHFQAADVEIDDEMDVFLTVTFESECGQSVTLARAYRFDSDHECMGPPWLWHDSRQPGDTARYSWGGSDAVRGIDLRRGRIFIRVSGHTPPHPQGYTGFDIRFHVTDAVFDRLQGVLNRCFIEFAWYVEKT
jgi:hypothetical protein